MMQVINIHEAKTHLSRLVEQVADGEPFIIAKAGKPMAKVMPLDAAEKGYPQRLGFMTEQCKIPDDFDAMGSIEIAQLFTGDA
jgi:prevent-host-death family protein